MSLKRARDRGREAEIAAIFRRGKLVEKRSLAAALIKLGHESLGDEERVVRGAPACVVASVFRVFCDLYRLYDLCECV